MPKKTPADSAKFRSSTTRDGNGPGWGGPAKGAKTVADKPMPPPFTLGNQASAVERDYSRRDKAQALKDHLYRLATEAEKEETQVRAAEAWLNRIEGTPVQRNINVSADDLSALDDAALDARADAIEAELRASARGAAAQNAPARPGRVVN